MANHKNALKKQRQNITARARNRYKKIRMRSAVRKLRRAIRDGELETARELLIPTLSLVDRSAKHGVIHANAAARAKSRLTRAVQAAG